MKHRKKFGVMKTTLKECLVQDTVTKLPCMEKTSDILQASSHHSTTTTTTTPTTTGTTNPPAQQQQQAPHTSKHNKLQESLSHNTRDDVKKKIGEIVLEVEQWSDTEKLLLYLKLPGSKHCAKQHDDKDSQNIPLSTTRAEQTQAFHWIRSHLEECENNSTLPKHEVYDEYKAHCESVNAVRVLSAPDFGKIIKCVFPNVKARRLGTRGNSKYCYSGIQKKHMVKSPQLPNILAPTTDNDNNMSSSNGSVNGSEKIGEDQTLVAACKLVCEWANKLLGRVFTTLTELARFLVVGSYVSSKSMSAFVVMSTNENCTMTNKLTLNTVQFSEQHASLTEKRKQTQQHLQRKIQQRQQHKQHLNLIVNPSTPNTNQFTPILPQTQKAVNHLSQVNTLRTTQPSKPQHLQLSPTKLHLSTALKSPPTQRTPVIYNQSPQRTLAHLPSCNSVLSPVTSSLTSPSMQQNSPYSSTNKCSPKRSAPCTPRSATITPSPASTTPRNTPNGEATRFVFTPITSVDGKIQGGEGSPPMLKRPMATHPGHNGTNDQFINQSNNSSPRTAVNQDNPVSPCKQPRLNLAVQGVATLNKQNNCFSQHLPSQKRSQVLSNIATTLTNVLPVSCQQSSNKRNNVDVTRSPVARRQNVLTCSPHNQQHLATAQSYLDYNFVSSQDCRFNSRATQNDVTPGIGFLVPSAHDIEEICNQLSNTANQMNRSHSVPPLQQHMRTTSNAQPLTPNRQRVGSFIGHVDGLKEIRHRVLHGDNNNNGGGVNIGSPTTTTTTTDTPQPTIFAAKRNLMSELENIASAPAIWPSSGSTPQGKTTHAPVLGAGGAGDPLACGLSLEEIANAPVNAAAATGFEMFVEETADALFADSTNFTHAWNVAQPLTMDSCM